MTQPTPTVPMTPAEAQLWLAGLEKPCPAWTELTICHGPACPDCHGSGKVPVLTELREDCPGCKDCGRFELRTLQFPSARGCKGRLWFPSQSETVLHQAMNKAGWDVDIHQGVDGTRRVTMFWQRAPIVIGNHSIFPDSEDADDWLAAVKALRAAGYG